jgi:GTPase SAR1 family protein
MTGNGPIFKILFLGDSAIGKRSICDRIVTGDFQPEVKATMAR